MDLAAAPRSFPPRSGSALLELTGISKRYGELAANADISLRVAPGSIHAVLGENGAGKSTLMRIIYGLTSADEGRIVWQGRELSAHTPDAARALGIAMVFQHFSLFDAFSVAENVWLGTTRGTRLSDVARRVRELSGAYGLALDPERPVHTLSIGEKQAVELVRALYTTPQLLIMDEPTSVLTPQAVDALFATLRALSARGTSILYISHKLPEVRALCDRCSVLRTWWGVKEGAIDFVSIASAVPAETKQRLEDVKQGLRRGSFHPWTGPIVDQAGVVLLKDGEQASDDFLRGLKSYVRAVEGKLPN